MKKPGKINNAEEEWFEKFYSKSFSDVIYTNIEDADQYVHFLKSALYVRSVRLGRLGRKARWPELRLLSRVEVSSLTKCLMSLDR